MVQFLLNWSKIRDMKKLLISFLFVSSIIVLNAQNDRSTILQNLENTQPSGQNQDIQVIGILKSASRLFGAKDDLTSVIMVIPSGDTVGVIDADSAYLHVYYQDYEGYILKSKAVLSQAPTATGPASQSQENAQPTEPVQQQENNQSTEPDQQQEGSRFSYLENKYGTSMAASIYAGKIWKGMSSDMVRDSWGKPLRINRVISGNVIKEEWIYNNTWLFFENDNLVQWGPANR